MGGSRRLATHPVFQKTDHPVLLIMTVLRTSILKRRSDTRRLTNVGVGLPLDVHRNVGQAGEGRHLGDQRLQPGRGCEELHVRLLVDVPAWAAPPCKQLQTARLSIWVGILTARDCKR